MTVAVDAELERSMHTSCEHHCDLGPWILPHSVNAGSVIDLRCRDPCNRTRFATDRFHSEFLGEFSDQLLAPR